MCTRISYFNHPACRTVTQAIPIPVYFLLAILLHKPFLFWCTSCLPYCYTSHSHSYSGVLTACHTVAQAIPIPILVYFLLTTLLHKPFLFRCPSCLPYCCTSYSHSYSGVLPACHTVAQAIPIPILVYFLLATLLHKPFLFRCTSCLPYCCTSHSHSCSGVLPAYRTVAQAIHIPILVYFLLAILLHKPFLFRCTSCLPYCCTSHSHSYSGVLPACHTVAQAIPVPVYFLLAILLHKPFPFLFRCTSCLPYCCTSHSHSYSGVLSYNYYITFRSSQADYRYSEINDKMSGITLKLGNAKVKRCAPRDLISLAGAHIFVVIF